MYSVSSTFTLKCVHNGPWYRLSAFVGVCILLSSTIDNLMVKLITGERNRLAFREHTSLHCFLGQPQKEKPIRRMHKDKTPIAQSNQECAPKRNNRNLAQEEVESGSPEDWVYPALYTKETELVCYSHLSRDKWSGVLDRLVLIAPYTTEKSGNNVIIIPSCAL